MSYQYIEVTQEGRIATVILNRPEVSNAFHTVSYQEVADAMDRFSADPTVGAVVITGRGKHFSAGGDLLSFREEPQSIPTVRYKQRSRPQGGWPYRSAVARSPRSP